MAVMFCFCSAMVHRTYIGLGSPQAAVAEFDKLRPYAGKLLELQRECRPLGPDHAAIAIAYDGLQTAAYHFTRRAQFYDDLRQAEGPCAEGNRRLADPAEARVAFENLTPHALQLRNLMIRCRPFGRDYLALKVAMDSLETSAFHFTHIPRFYAAKSDSAGPLAN